MTQDDFPGAGHFNRKTDLSSNEFDESWSTYKKASNLLKKECNKARWEYLDKLANDMHDNSKHKLFWNYVQSRRKRFNDLIVIKLDNNNVLTNEGDIAECMNEYFEKAAGSVLDYNEVFIREQFGFLKGKSCLSQLLSSFHDWARERNKGLTTDVIFFDLQFKTV